MSSLPIKTINIIIFFLIFSCSVLYANDSVRIKYLNELDRRFSEYNENSSTEEVILMLSDAETVCRLVLAFNISEEGGNDYQIGQFVEKLIESDRWDVLDKVLEHHFYYPQTTGWIITSLSYKKKFYISKIEKIKSEYSEQLRHTDNIIKNLIKILKERDKKSKR